MTDNTEKNVSPVLVGWTDEEIKAFCGEPDTYTRMKCETCGYEENVPDWVLAEFSDMDKVTGHSDSEVGTECPKCGKDMYKKK